MAPRLRCEKRKPKVTVRFQIGERLPEKPKKKSTRGKPRKSIAPTPTPSMATATAVRTRKRTTARMSTGGKWKAPPKKKIALTPIAGSSQTTQAVSAISGKNHCGQRSVGRPKKSAARTSQKNKGPVGRPSKSAAVAPQENKRPVGRPKKLAITPIGSSQIAGSGPLTSGNKSSSRRPVQNPVAASSTSPSTEPPTVALPVAVVATGSPATAPVGNAPAATAPAAPIAVHRNPFVTQSLYNRQRQTARMSTGGSRPVYRKSTPVTPTVALPVAVVATSPPATAPVGNAPAATAPVGNVPAATAPVGNAPAATAPAAPIAVHRNPFVTQSLYNRQRQTARMSTGGSRPVYRKSTPVTVELLSEEE